MFANNRLIAVGLIIILIAIFLGIQLPGIGNMPWEKYDSWRQSDTYSIAVNYHQYEYNILKPQFNYDGPADNYIQLELQIMPFMAATAFKILGTTTPAIPRAINLMFFIASALFVYFIMRRFTEVLPSVCGFAVYLFMPITLLYSRAIMPEAPALFFYCGGVYFLLRWYLDSKNIFMWISALLVAIAITQKTPIIFIGILILYTFISKLKKDCIRSPLFYGYGAIALGIPALYYFYSSTIATFKFVNGITLKHVFTKEIFSIFTKEGLKFFYTNLPMNFGWMLLIFAGIGLLLSFSKKRSFVLVWAAAILLEWVTIVALIRFGYYLIFMAPVLSVLCAIAVSELWKWKKQIAVFGTVFMICSTAYLGVIQFRSRVIVDEKIDAAAAFIRNNTGSDDIIAVSSVNPVYHNAANRRGYRANIKYYDYIPRDPEDEIKYFIEHGVSHFVVVGGSIPNDDNGYLAYLEANYTIVGSDGYCTLFSLN